MKKTTKLSALFEDYACGEISRGRLIKSGADYLVRHMDYSDLDLSIALQDHVLQTLKKLGASNYIIAKDKAYLSRLLDRGSAIIGTFVPDTNPQQPDRLAAHMLVVYPHKESDTGLSDPSVLGNIDLDKVAVVSNILVHEDFRGNRLMQQMLEEGLKLAAANNKSHAIAEICIDNPFSWGVFLDCGFAIYAEATDPEDGAELVYAHKPLESAFIYSRDPQEAKTIQIFDGQGILDPQAHQTLKDLLAQDYHVTGFDRRSNTMQLARCIGTAPLSQFRQVPRSPMNDNRP